MLEANGTDRSILAATFFLGTKNRLDARYAVCRDVSRTPLCHNRSRVLPHSKPESGVGSGLPWGCTRRGEIQGQHRGVLHSESLTFANLDRLRKQRFPILIAALLGELPLEHL